MRGMASTQALCEAVRRVDANPIKRHMTDLSESLQRMTFMQLTLLLAFLTSYVLALGGLLGTVARRRCAVLALLCAVGFSAFTDPWVHGALLMVFVVAGLGVFVALSWLLARLFSPNPRVLETEFPVQTSLLVDSLPPMPHVPLQQAESGNTRPPGTANALR